MNKHLGEYKLENEDIYENLIVFADYVDKLVFNFENYNLDVYQIVDLSLNHDGNIIIELALFNPYLYNAFVSEEKINTLIEYGRYYNAANNTNEYKYNTSYNAYKIKSVCGSKSGGSWIYILEPISE